MKKTVREGEEKTNIEYVSELSACELTLANQASKDQIKYKAHTYIEGKKVFFSDAALPVTASHTDP